MRRLLVPLAVCILAAVAVPVAPAAETITAKTVAILDFENTNTEASEDDWLCAGMAETLITKLRQVRDLHLVERKQIIKATEELDFSTSDFFDAEKSEQLARFLKVDVLLVGGFQHYGNAIRITARFVDVSTGEVLEAVDIKGKMDNIFDLQDQLALKLIESLGIETTRRERKTVAENPTTSLSALELYGKALKTDDAQEEIALLRQAIEADPEYKEAYNDLAVVYMDQENYATAIDLLKKALDVDESYFLAHFNLGVCYYQLGRFDESARSHKRATECNENYTFAYLALAEVYLAQYDYRRAIEVARQAVELDPSEPRGYNLWGHGLSGQERYDEAIEKFQQVIELNPEAAYAYSNIANCYGRLDEPDNALEFYGKALEIEPDYALAYYRRASLYYFALNDAHKAAVDFAKYIQYEEGDPDGYIGLARAYVELGRTDDAKEAYETAIDLQPNLPHALYELANLCFDNEDYDRAEQLYLEALKVDPDIIGAYHNLGRIYAYVRGDQDTAASYFERALAVDRDHTPSLTELARVELRRERWDDMITWLMRGRKLEPEDPFWHYFLGYAYDEKATASRDEGKTRTAQRYTETAEKHLREAARLNPDDPDVYNLLGNLRLNNGDPAEAVPYYEQALEANEDHVYANVNLGTANRQLGRYVEAERYFKRTLTLAPQYAFAAYQLAEMYDEDLHQPDDAVTYYTRYIEITGQDENIQARIKEIERGDTDELLEDFD